MNIKEKLSLLSAHYGFNRNVGHTTLMKEGVSNFDKEHIVVGHTLPFSKQLTKGNNGIPVSIESLNLLRGSTSPMTIDHFALQTLFDEALSEINRLEAEANKKEKINA